MALSSLLTYDQSTQSVVALIYSCPLWNPFPFTGAGPKERLQSRHEGVRLCLALAAPFTACFSLLFLVIVVASPVRFPDSPGEHQIRCVISESTTAGHCHPYGHPIRRIIPLENMKHQLERLASCLKSALQKKSRAVDPPITQTCFLVASTPRSPVPSFRSDQVNFQGT